VSSSSATESDADHALRELLDVAAKFQTRFTKAIHGKETGTLLLRVSYDRGRVGEIEMEARERDVRRVGRK
jgi:hypothetical protein